MKTPSQRSRDGRNHQIKFQTQFDVDRLNGVPSYEYSRESTINYNSQDGIRKKNGKEAAKIKIINEKRDKQVAKAEAEKKAKEEEKRLKLKNQTIFDIIDIED